MRFEDMTEVSGLFRAKGPGLGVVCADFDGDGEIHFGERSGTGLDRPAVEKMLQAIDPGSASKS